MVAVEELESSVVVHIQDIQSAEAAPRPGRSLWVVARIALVVVVAGPEMSC